jgi:hypothetical protein
MLAEASTAARATFIAGTPKAFMPYHATVLVFTAVDTPLAPAAAPADADNAEPDRPVAEVAATTPAATSPARTRMTSSGESTSF